MTPTTVHIKGDNDLSHLILERLKHLDSLARTVIYSPSRHHHLPQKLFPATLAGLINLKDHITPPQWYAARNAAWSPLSETPENTDEPLIDCTQAGVRIKLQMDSRPDSAYTIRTAADIETVIPWFRISPAFLIENLSASSLQLAFVLAKAGKRIFIPARPAFIIHPDAGSDAQALIRKIACEYGIELTEKTDIYPRLSVEEDSQRYLITGPVKACDAILKLLAPVNQGNELCIVNLGNSSAHYLLPPHGKPGGETIMVSCTPDNILRKIWINNNRITGFILIGDISGSDTLAALCRNQTDIRQIRDHLLHSA
ncbi:hypothetical protein ACQUQU_18175 [Thalassolituus sp. LLYu03]|uniref:hypothetical protein n=1 Tax=Thalassolituus sp. LLYu03 TaxID=3421656 RepID=UPI003D2A9BD4